jgi:ATP/ADP translocase
MSLVGNFAPIVSGIYVTYLAKYLKAFSPLSDDHIFERSLQCSSLVMTGSIAMIAFLHSLLTKAAIKEQVQLSSANTSTTSEATPPSTTPHPVPTTTPASPPLSARESKPQRKRPLSIRESFGVLATDKYLTNIAKMVLSYGLAIEFTEILWKAIVKKGLTPLCLSLTFLSSPDCGSLPNTDRVHDFHDTVLCSCWCRIDSHDAHWLKLSLITRMADWSALDSRLVRLVCPSLALISVVVMGVVALPFYFSLIFSKYFKSPSALLIPVYIGLLQNVLSKVTQLQRRIINRLTRPPSMLSLIPRKRWRTSLSTKRRRSLAKPQLMFFVQD